MQYYNYVMSVLLPECVIRIIADFHNVSFDEVSRERHTVCGCKPKALVQFPHPLLLTQNFDFLAENHGL